jgi:hypothetical protein
MKLDEMENYGRYGMAESPFTVQKNISRERRISISSCTWKYVEHSFVSDVK